MSLIKKENIVIAHEYRKNDGSTGKQYKTIGELITMQGSDGPYQFGKIWGPHGFTEIKVYPQQDQNRQAQGMQQAQNQLGQQQYQQQPAQGFNDFDNQDPF